MILDHFDEVRIINLAHRADRRAEMMEELRRVGRDQDPRISFFTACSFTDPGTFSSGGARGCFHSHLTILEQAAAANRSVLILEDDVDFRPGMESYDPPAEGWDVFYGGYHNKTDDLQTSDIAGSHFMGFTAAGVKMLVAYLHEILASGHHPPIDGAYVWFRRAHPEVGTEFAVPPLGYQRPSRTDIADLRWFDRVPGIKHALIAARKLKRRLLKLR